MRSSGGFIPLGSGVKPLLQNVGAPTFLVLCSGQSLDWPGVARTKWDLADL
jgi:hypothetical protein